MSLLGLRVEADHGLGGNALAEGRPLLSGGCCKSMLITHRYDADISAEGSVTLFATPVIVDRQVRAGRHEPRDRHKPGPDREHSEELSQHCDAPV